MNNRPPLFEIPDFAKVRDHKTCIACAKNIGVFNSEFSQSVGACENCLRIYAQIAQRLDAHADAKIAEKRAKFLAKFEK